MGMMKTLRTAQTMGSAGGSGSGSGSGSGIGLTCEVFFDRGGLERQIQRREFRALNRLGGYARRIARNSIKPMGAARKPPKKFDRNGQWTKAFRRWYRELRDRPASPPGTPPHTHGGNLRKAIVYGFDRAKRRVVVGPQASVMDEVAALHEHGGSRFGKRYPARPFMAPARDKAMPQLPRFLREAG